MNFGDALMKLWPNGDERIPGLRQGMIDTAASVFAKYGISNQTVMNQLMAQISHECGAGHEVIENLSYSAQRMTQVWPGRFPTVAKAEPYAHNPQKLANNVYGSRMGNRAGTDDGWNFRGRGASQTTGREGYEKLAAKTGLDLINHPELINDPAHFLECGVADFILCGCLPYALNDDIAGVTKRLNGGLIGLAERKAWLARWQAAGVSMPTGGKAPSVGKPSVPIKKPIGKKPIGKVGGVVVAGGAAAGAAHQAGVSIGWVVIIGIVVAVTTAIVVWKLKK